MICRRSSVLEIVFLEKSQVHQIDPQMTLNYTGQMYPIYVGVLPASHKSLSVSLYNPSFSDN